MAALFSTTLSLFFAMLFLRTAWHKHNTFAETTGFVAGYGIIPAGYEVSVTRGLIATEALTAIMLVSPPFRAFGGAAAACLLTIYALAMMFAVWKGRSTIDCGCGGEPQFVSKSLIARNLILAVGALAITNLPTSSIGATTILPLAAALTFICSYSIVDRVLANATRIRLMAGTP